MGITEIPSFVAWLQVDDTGQERLMHYWSEDKQVVVPMLAFDRVSEDGVDRMARAVVEQTGRPGRKVYFKRDRLLGEMF